MSGAVIAGRNQRGGIPVWVRLLCLVGAFTAGTVVYQHLWVEFYSWWNILLELATGSLLLGVAFDSSGAPAGTESATRRTLRGLAWGIAAAAAGLGAYYWTIRGQELITVAAGCVAVAAALCARWVPFAPADIEALTGEGSPPATRSGPWPTVSVLLAVAAVGLGVAACGVNLAQFYLAAFLLWVASLAVFAFAMFRVDDAPATHTAPGWLEDGGPQLSRRSEAAALLLILALALALRVPLLDKVPALIDADEGRLGRYAEKMWNDGFPDAFALGWNAFGTQSYMLDYLGAQVLGPSNSHLRLGAALIGVVSLIPMFYWVRRWWGNIIALLALFMVAIAHEHVYWSRVAFNNIQAVLAASLLLAAFARALQTRRLVDWVWVGYAIGFGFHTYHAAKLFPALVAGAAVFYALGMPGFLRRYWRGALVGALAFVMYCGPLLVTIYHDWNGFYRNTSNRMDVAEMLAGSRAGDFVAVRNHLSSHIAGTLLSFVNIPWQLGLFDPYLCVPFLIGVGWMLWRWRDPRHLLVIVWTAGIAVIASMLTSYPPNKPRMVGLLPVVFVIPAVIAGRIRALAQRAMPLRADAVWFPLLIVWLGMAAYHNWWTEFVFRPSLNRADVMTNLCHIIDDLPPRAGMYMAGEGRPNDPKVAVIDCMIASNPDRVIVNLPDDPRMVPLPPQHRGGAVMGLSGPQRELAPLVQHYYPDARFDIVHNLDGAENLYTFTLSEREVEQHRGLRATYQSGQRTWSPPEGVDMLLPPEDAEFPLLVTWRGEVWVDPPGPYRFRGLGGTLRVDGTPTDGTTPLDLAAGWHTVELTGLLLHPNEMAVLEWLPAWDTTWQKVPREFLDTHPESHGLLGRYFNRAIEGASPAPLPEAPGYSEIIGALSFDLFTEVDDTPPPIFSSVPSTMEWTGTVELPEGGDPTFRLETTNPAQVFLDRRLVISTAGTPQGSPIDVTVPGLSGQAQILVRTTRPATADRMYWKLRLLWRDAGGTWTAFVRYHPPGNGTNAGVE